MVFKFTIISDEADDFIRVIEIDSEATFFDLHKAILQAVDYSDDQITSFFLCSDDWEKEQEVTLMEMDSGSEYDNMVMDETKLEDLIEDEKQKLLYVFDMISDRAFFMELTEIITGENLDKAICTMETGMAPEQFMMEDVTAITQKLTIDENFYGDESFEMDELDEEGFGDVSFNDDTNFADDF